MDAEGARSEMSARVLESAGALDSVVESCVHNVNSSLNFASLFEVLFDLRLSREEGDLLAEQVRVHRAEIATRLGREVDFRVAALDYFCSTQTRLQNPMITELSDYEVRLRLSVTDELTGMYNRRFLLDALHRELHRSNRYHIPFSLLFIDIDNFKTFNDNYGHKTGDDVLKSFSGFLKQFLRSEDIVGRYGGEEFLLLMPQTDTDGAVALGNRLLEGLTGKPVHQHFNITFSGGIATFPDHAPNVDDLIEMADIAMYNSKMQGKRQISVAAPNKRQDERFPVSRLSHITLRCYTKNDGQLSGSIRNLSHSGISFDAASPLQIGEELDLHLSARGDGSHLDIHGKVVWIRETEEAARYRVGARYARPVSREIDLLISPPY